jgi:hypothetical protein
LRAILPALRDVRFLFKFQKEEREETTFGIFLFIENVVVSED